MLIFTDLTDTEFSFKIDIESDDFSTPNFYFKIAGKHVNYLREYSRQELQQLRTNCMAILRETNLLIQGE